PPTERSTTSLHAALPICRRSIAVALTRCPRSARRARAPSGAARSALRPVTAFYRHRTPQRDQRDAEGHGGDGGPDPAARRLLEEDRKSTRLNSSHVKTSY